MRKHGIMAKVIMVIMLIMMFMPTTGLGDGMQFIPDGNGGVLFIPSGDNGSTSSSQTTEGTTPPASSASNASSAQETSGMESSVAGSSSSGSAVTMPETTTTEQTLAQAAAASSDESKAVSVFFNSEPEGARSRTVANKAAAETNEQSTTENSFKLTGPKTLKVGETGTFTASTTITSVEANGFVYFTFDNMRDQKQEYMVGNKASKSFAFATTGWHEVVAQYSNGLGQEYNFPTLKLDVYVSGTNNTGDCNCGDNCGCGNNNCCDDCKHKDNPGDCNCGGNGNGGNNCNCGDNNCNCGGGNNGGNCNCGGGNNGGNCNCGGGNNGGNCNCGGGNNGGNCNCGGNNNGNCNGCTCTPGNKCPGCENNKCGDGCNCGCKNDPEPPCCGDNCTGNKDTCPGCKDGDCDENCNCDCKKPSDDKCCDGKCKDGSNCDGCNSGKCEEQECECGCRNKPDDKCCSGNCENGSKCDGCDSGKCEEQECECGCRNKPDDGKCCPGDCISKDDCPGCVPGVKNPCGPGCACGCQEKPEEESVGILVAVHKPVIEYGEHATVIATLLKDVADNSGKIDFYKGATKIDTKSVVSNKASIEVRLPNAGQYSYIAQYQGKGTQSNWADLTVRKVRPRIEMTAQSAQVTTSSGVQVNLVAQVYKNKDGAIPIGQVAFMYGNQMIAYGTVNNMTGIATGVWTTGIPKINGSVKIVARYIPDYERELNYLSNTASEYLLTLKNGTTDNNNNNNNNNGNGVLPKPPADTDSTGNTGGNGTGNPNFSGTGSMVSIKRLSTLTINDYDVPLSGQVVRLLDEQAVELEVYDSRIEQDASETNVEIMTSKQYQERTHFTYEFNMAEMRFYASNYADGFYEIYAGDIAINVPYAFYGAFPGLQTYLTEKNINIDSLRLRATFEQVDGSAAALNSYTLETPVWRVSYELYDPLGNALDFSAQEELTVPVELMLEASDANSQLLIYDPVTTDLQFSEYEMNSNKAVIRASYCADYALAKEQGIG